MRLRLVISNPTGNESSKNCAPLANGSLTWPQALALANQQLSQLASLKPAHALYHLDQIERSLRDVQRQPGRTVIGQG